MIETAERVCTCGYEARRAARSGAPVLSPEWSLRALDWHYADCAWLAEYPLRPLTDTPICDKCGQNDIASQFHEARWYYEPHHHDFWRHDLYTWSCLLTHGYRPVEHIDRTCRTCHFGWLERTAG